MLEGSPVPHELELRDIVKRYGHLLANNGVSLTVEHGEIRAIVGENGAGKSTLMSILYGEQRPDSGEIVVRGERRSFHSPLDAIHAGLGMVHQSFMLFPSLTVAENVIFGAEPAARGLIDRRKAAAEVREVAERYGLRVNPGARVGSLPVGVRQRVEIVKALYRGADILILDEPTAVLTPQEVEGLFETLRTLREQGKTVLFITHKLHEVMRLCDNATVMRDGKVTATVKVSETTPQELSRYMTGRDVQRVAKPPVKAGDAVLRVEELAVIDEERRPLVDGATLAVRAGEIVAIAGVAGNGQTELVESLVGIRPVSAGKVLLCGQDVTGASVATHRRAGLAYVPEDRSHVGAVLGASVAQNLAMGFQRQPSLSRHGLLKLDAIRQRAAQLIRQYTIKVSSPGAFASSLSGGNLQKVTLARELSHDAPCLIAEQPTRGLDIGAIEFVHQQLLSYRSDGHAILLVSAELSEILTLADRILVMFEGRIVGEVPAAEATEEQLGLMMAGAHEPAGVEGAGV